MLTKDERKTIAKLMAEYKDAQNILSDYLNPSSRSNPVISRKIVIDMKCLVAEAERNLKRYLDAITGMNLTGD